MAADVFLDEKFIGKVANPLDFAKKIKEERRNQRLPTTLNVSYDSEFNEVYINIVSGRARRPVVVAENGVSRLTEEHIEKVSKGEMSWQDLVEQLWVKV